MPIHRVKDKYLIYLFEVEKEQKFRTELSKLIIEKFGKGKFDHTKTIEIISFGLRYAVDKFKEICFNETSVRFYQNALFLHEQVTELTYLHSNSKGEEYSKEINKKYTSKYRRTLKYILEMGCEVPMIAGEGSGADCRKRIEPKLNDCLVLGELMMMFGDLYAEQNMIEDVVNISFNENELFVFSRNHHYEFIFEHVGKEFRSQLSKSVYDETGLADLKNALQTCFGIKYEDVGHVIASIHQELEPKGGQLCGVGWETLPYNLNGLFNVPLEISEQFFQGLRLDKGNKMDLFELVCKPYKLNRYIYKPIIIWSIDGKDYALIGKNAWSESMIQYATNAIPWGKAPEVWMKNECFKNYVHRKEDEHDKWLDNAVEGKLNNLNLKFDRNIKRLKSKNGDINIDIKGLGEVDFIIIAKDIKKIFIVDCKHLLGRYDLINQKNDYNSFSIGSKNNKSYNQTMMNKVTWFKENKDKIVEHFKIKYNIKEFSVEDYNIEGIFIINTPTIYMYNSDYRIYTIYQIEEVLKGKFIDPTFNIFIDGEEDTKNLNVTYPYFKKPQYIYI